MYTHTYCGQLFLCCQLTLIFCLANKKGAVYLKSILSPKAEVKKMFSFPIKTHTHTHTQRERERERAQKVFDSTIFDATRFSQAVSGSNK